MKRVMLLLGLLGLVSISSHAVPMREVVSAPIVVSVSSVSAANSQAQINISTPSYGQYSEGKYTYLTSLYVVAYASGTTVGISTPTTCTSTNLQSLGLTFPTAIAVGAQSAQSFSWSNSLQASNTGYVQITCPATAGIVWRMFVTYFQGL